MRTRSGFVALLVAGAGCATAHVAPAALPPLGEDGEVHVYALPLPRDAERVTFMVESVALVLRDGSEVPLKIETRQLAGARRTLHDQRLLASGRGPPREYAGLALKIASATLAADGEPARLLVDPEPARIDLPFVLASGRAVVVWLQVEPGAVRADYSFSPRVGATIPPPVPPQAGVYCTAASSDRVVAVDRGSRLVTSVVPLEGTPRGIAVDVAARRAYVALSSEDRIEVLDLSAGTVLGRVRLAPGDRPSEVAIAPDGRLVVLNEGSRSVSFLDPSALAEQARVPVGEDPVALTLDRAGRRAYVANRGSATVTVLDLPRRAVLGTLATDPEPLRTALSRDGARLFVAQRGSADLLTFGIPSLAPASRVHVGLGARVVRVDPRSDLVYVAYAGDRRLSVLDPVSLQRVDVIELPGEPSQLVIDDAANTLLALLRDRGAIAVVDLTSRTLLAEIPVGALPGTMALSGERL